MCFIIYQWVFISKVSLKRFSFVASLKHDFRSGFAHLETLKILAFFNAYKCTATEHVYRWTYSALQKFLNEIKFLTISKNMFILNALYKQYGSKIRPNKTLVLIFDPYCLIYSISFCWKLVVLCGITWIMRLHKFCKFYKLSKNFWRALYIRVFWKTIVLHWAVAAWCSTMALHKLLKHFVNIDNINI